MAHQPLNGDNILRTLMTTGVGMINIPCNERPSPGIQLNSQLLAMEAPYNGELNTVANRPHCLPALAEVDSLKRII
jgi:hypothetical protein